MYLWKSGFSGFTGILVRSWERLLKGLPIACHFKPLFYSVNLQVQKSKVSAICQLSATQGHTGLVEGEVSSIQSAQTHAGRRGICTGPWKERLSGHISGWGLFLTESLAGEKVWEQEMIRHLWEIAYKQFFGIEGIGYVGEIRERQES